MKDLYQSCISEFLQLSKFHFDLYKTSDENDKMKHQT